jgi:transposase
MKYHIKEQDWATIYQNLREEKGLHTKTEKKLRIFCEAIWYICRSGCQWRLLPSCYGSWRAIHRRFFRWAQQGIWARLLEKAQIDPDLEAVMIDATLVRAHACSAGYGKDSQKAQALGRCVGGFTSKINAMVDALGNPLKFLLSCGQQHDIKAAMPLIEGITDSDVLADRGYDDDKLIKAIEAQGGRAVIPPRKNRKELREYDKNVYKERHLIECFFGKIKYFRRIFSRFEKTANAYMAFLNVAAVFIWLK